MQNTKRNIQRSMHIDTWAADISVRGRAGYDLALMRKLVRQKILPFSPCVVSWSGTDLRARPVGRTVGAGARGPAPRPLRRKDPPDQPKAGSVHGGDRRHERLAFSRSAWYHAKQWVSGISAVGSAGGLGETARTVPQLHIGVLRSW